MYVYPIADMMSPITSQRGVISHEDADARLALNRYNSNLKRFNDRIKRRRLYNIFSCKQRVYYPRNIEDVD